MQQHRSGEARATRVPRRSATAEADDGREPADRGATTLEYAMLVAFIAIAITSAVAAFTGDLSTVIGAIGTHVAGWAGGLN